MTDFSKLLEQAKELEKKMRASQENIKKIKAIGTSAGGEVKVTLNGENEMVNLEINDNILKEKKEIIIDLIIASYNNAKTDIKSKTSEEISKNTTDINLSNFKWPL